MKGLSLFLLSAYALMLMQLCISFGIAYKLRDADSIIDRLPKTWVLTLLSIGILALLALVPMPMPIKFFVFTIFAVVVGIFLLLLTRKFDTELVSKALVGAIATFVMMSIVGLILVLKGIDLTPMSMVLFAALIVLVVTSVVFIFVRVSKTIYKVYLSAICIVMALLTMYDTNIIMSGNYTGDVIDAATALYLNVTNLFQGIFELENINALLGGN